MDNCHQSAIGTANRIAPSPEIQRPIVAINRESFPKHAKPALFQWNLLGIAKVHVQNSHSVTEPTAFSWPFHRRPAATDIGVNLQGVLCDLF